MMTRKDYIETANILADFRDSLEEHIFDGLVNRFAIMFQDDNPRFDDVRFENACWGEN